MKLNKEFIQQLRNGEIAAENSGTLEQLTEVLKAAFPEDEWIADGTSRYYYLSTGHPYLSTGRPLTKWDWDSGNRTNLPTFKISDFFQPELFTGWAKDDRFPEWMVYFKDEIAQYGFDGCEYEWISGVGMYRPRYSEIEDNRPATHEEIEQGLAEEAKRMGYKGGNTIKGFHGTTHIGYEIISFTYDAENDRLLTDEGCVVYKAGQWAEIVEQPKTKTSPIHYTVDGTTYSLNYQELKDEYNKAIAYTHQEFMQNLPQIAHLTCIVAYFKGLGTQDTISDKGIIHELIHLMTNPEEPTNDLAEIRKSFNDKIKLV